MTFTQSAVSVPPSDEGGGSSNDNNNDEFFEQEDLKRNGECLKEVLAYAGMTGGLNYQFWQLAFSLPLAAVSGSVR